MSKSVSYAVASLLIAGVAAADPIEIPRASPHASVSQTVGTTVIAIDYHRPGVKGRKIWGELVPYEQIWRLGANDATTISFTDAVWIDGKEVPAGTYALFAIPTADSWTFVLNRAAKQWGASSHDDKEDQLRFQAKTRAGAFTEWMRFALTPTGESTVDVELNWDSLAISFPIEVKVRELTWARIDAALKASDVDAATWARAANYAISTNERTQYALTWIEKSLELKRTTFSVEAHAKLLHLNGRTAEAIAEMMEARKLGEGQLPVEFFKRVDAALAEWRAMLPAAK